MNKIKVNTCWLMNYSREKSRQSLLEALCYSQGKPITYLADATIDRCISMAASSLILRQL